jgi:TonB family protein
MSKKPYVFKELKPEDALNTGPKPDFNAFLGEYQNIYQSGKATKPLYKKPAFMLTTMFLATIVLVLLLLPEKKGTENKTANPKENKGSPTQQTAVKPDTAANKRQSENVPNTENTRIENNQTTVRSEALLPDDGLETTREQNLPSKPLAFQGDPDGWEGYVARNIRQPNESIQGSVTLTFTIDTTGKVKNISIASGKGMGYPYDGEAIRLLHLSSGKWRPAIEKGKKVEKVAEVKVAFQMKYDTTY